MKTQTQSRNCNPFIATYYFDKCPEELRPKNLKPGILYGAQGYFDEITEILGREPDWVRVDAIAFIYPEDVHKMFKKLERPFEQKGLTKIQWWFGFQYLGEAMVAGERHLKIKQLFLKKQDIDSTVINGNQYVQAPIEHIMNGTVDGLKPCEAENWSKYRDKVEWM